MKRILVTTISSLVASGFMLTNAQAESAWMGNAELGVILTSGNTETQSTNGKLNFTNEREKWRHFIGLEALNISDKDDTTAERYSGMGKSAFKFRELDYAFALGKAEHDRFSGYDYRTSLVLGYGRRLMHRDNMRLDVELGPGLRVSKPDKSKAENEAVFYVGGKYEWDISEAAKFTQELNSEIGKDAAISKSVSSLTAKVANDLAMKATLTLRHTSEVPEDVEKMDTETALTLVYSF